MSTPIAQYKLPSRIEIGFDSEAKAAMADLRIKLDEVNKNLSARDSGLWSESKKKSNSRIGQIVADAVSKQLKEISRPDGLLKAMQAPAANDSAVLNAPMSVPWENDLNLATVNDVDYLSGNDLDECVPPIDDVLDQPNWLSESVPQITQADMQLIFIKNLSETLIQRMHSMDRFSEDDYAIGGDKLIAWDILIYEPLDAYAVLMRGPDRINVADLLLIRDGGPMADAGWNTTSEAFAILRTITEAELPAFSAALEACYA